MSYRFTLRRLARVAALGAAVALTLAVRSAAAQTAEFSGTGQLGAIYNGLDDFSLGEFSFSFSLPASPTPNFFDVDGNSFAYFPAEVTFFQGGHTGTLGGFLFFRGPGHRDGPGFELSQGEGAYIAAYFTDPIFSGPPSAPTFIPGTYVSTTPSPSPTDGPVTRFTITTTATVPEPGSVALLATGLVGLAGVVRSRRGARTR